jgi:cyanate permease
MTETKSNDSENNANIQPTQQPSNTKNGTVIHFIEMLSVPTAVTIPFLLTQIQAKDQKVFILYHC